MAVSKSVRNTIVPDAFDLALVVVLIVLIAVLVVLVVLVVLITVLLILVVLLILILVVHFPLPPFISGGFPLR